MFVIRIGLTPVVLVLECLTFFYTIRSDHQHANNEFRYMMDWLLHVLDDRTQRISLRASSC